MGRDQEQQAWQCMGRDQEQQAWQCAGSHTCQMSQHGAAPSHASPLRCVQQAKAAHAHMHTAAQTLCA
eukprot:366097-Chlamydomonas_euryale.AAC.47